MAPTRGGPCREGAGSRSNSKTTNPAVPYEPNNANEPKIRLNRTVATQQSGGGPSRNQGTRDLTFPSFLVLPQFESIIHPAMDPSQDGG